MVVLDYRWQPVADLTFALPVVQLLKDQSPGLYGLVC